MKIDWRRLLEPRPPCSKTEHAALKIAIDAAAWDLLPFVARFIYSWGQVDEVRDCPKCGDALVRTVVEGEPEFLEEAA